MTSLCTISEIAIGKYEFFGGEGGDIAESARILQNILSNLLFFFAISK